MISGDRGMNPVAMTIINPLKEYWQSWGSNQRSPVLKSCTLPTEVLGLCSKVFKCKYTYFTNQQSRLIDCMVLKHSFQQYVSYTVAATALIHSFLDFFLQFLLHTIFFPRHWLLFHITIIKTMDSSERNRSCHNEYHQSLEKNPSVSAILF